MQLVGRAGVPTSSTRKTIGCCYQPAPAEHNKDHHLPRFVFIFFFPGHSPEPSSGLAPRRGALQESHKSLAKHPAPSTLPGQAPLIDSLESASRTIATPLFLTWTLLPSIPSLPLPHLPGAAPSRNDCNGLARIASAVQVSNLLISKALQDALEGIMSCQCRAIK